MKLQNKKIFELNHEVPVLEVSKEGLLKGGFIAPTIEDSELDLLGVHINNCKESQCTTNVNCPLCPTVSQSPTPSNSPTPSSPKLDVLGTSLLF